MSDSTAPNAEAAPRTRLFRKRFDMPRLSPEAQQRQGRISTEAFLALGRDEALRFLNTPDAALGGRPLELATESAEGLAKVRQAIGDVLKRQD